MKKTKDTTESATDKSAEGEPEKIANDGDVSDIEDIDDADEIEKRLPDNNNALLDFMETSLACSLLLEVKQHLKAIYGFTDA